jgi:hypothetical protein
MGFQPLMVPSRVAKRKIDLPALRCSMMVKSFGLGLMFPTVPVGMPGVPSELFDAGGIVTKRGICCPVRV